MKLILTFNLKLILCLLSFLPFQDLYSQPAAGFDEIIFEIYNLDFIEVPAKIAELKKTSPKIANYLQIDYLWWKLISVHSQANESEFLAALALINNPDKNNAYRNYDRLIYFTYQIRYENLKNKNLSKYLTLLKFHFFMENIDVGDIKNPDSFVLSMFGLMDELDAFMKYKFLADYGLSTKSNAEKCRLSLQKMESMHNQEYQSFDVVKTYLLAKIYLEIENNKQMALTKFSKLSTRFPGNTIFKQTIADCKKQPISEH